MKTPIAHLRSIPALLALATLALLPPRPTHAADVFWDSNTSGDWHTATNWSNDLVPGVGDDVTIDRPGNLQIGINGLASVNSLFSHEAVFLANSLTLASDSTINGGLTMHRQFVVPSLGGSGNLSIGSFLTWADGTMQGAGKTILQPGTTATIGGGIIPTQVTLSRAFENAGTIDFAFTGFNQSRRF